MSPRFPPDIQPTVLRPGPAAVPRRPTGLSPSPAARSRALRPFRGRRPHRRPGPATPHPPALSGGCSVCPLPFSVAPTHGIACCFLFLRLLRCFSSAGSPSGGTPPATRAGVSPRSAGTFRPRREVPFGDPGFHGCMRLARAYRSLPRPSSAPEPRHPPDGLADPAGPDGPRPGSASGACVDPGAPGGLPPRGYPGSHPPRPLPRAGGSYIKFSHPEGGASGEIRPPHPRKTL